MSQHGDVLRKQLQLKVILIIISRKYQENKTQSPKVKADIPKFKNFLFYGAADPG